LLACSPFGVTEAVMHVHGFTRPILAKLVRVGFATAQSETGKTIAVGRIRITDAGRRWLEDASELGVRTGSRISGGSNYDRTCRWHSLQAQFDEPSPTLPIRGKK